MSASLMMETRESRFIAVFHSVAASPRCVSV